MKPMRSKTSSKYPTGVYFRKDAGPILPQYIEIMYLSMWRNRSELNQESDVCYAHVTRLLPLFEEVPWSHVHKITLLSNRISSQSALTLSDSPIT